MDLKKNIKSKCNFFQSNVAGLLKLPLELLHYKLRSRIHEIEKSIRVEMRWCPLYDNGSSLCCYVNSEQLSKLLGNDKNRFEALVDSKSRSRIRIDGYKKNLPSHREVVAYLLKKYPETKEICKNFLERLTKEKLNVLLEEYSIEILTQQSTAKSPCFFY